MILSEVNFHSETLGLRSQLTAILPQRKLSETRTGRAVRHRCLYLLHGLSDDHTAWQRWTSIERYVEGLNLVVIMPAVGRSFYSDMVSGGKYWTFLSEELPLVVGDLFPVSSRREDTFVAGLSMGGYGAFRWALTHPQRFAAAASLSGALDIRSSVMNADPAWSAEMRTIFGDLDRLAGSSQDLFALAQAAAGSKPRPRLFQYCGRQDFLYADNLRFRDVLTPLGFDLHYEEDDGDHRWQHWDAAIQKVLRWLDLA